VKTQKRISRLKTQKKTQKTHESFESTFFQQTQGEDS